MPHPRRVLLLALLSLGWAGLVPAFALELRTNAPEFELSTPLASKLRLSDFKGKWVYLDFWASWCGPCKESFPWMNEMQNRWGSKGLQVVGVNVDQKSEDAKAFLQTTRANFPIALDPQGKTPRSYEVRGMPTSFLIDPEGRIQFQHTGFSARDKAPLEAKIREALHIKDEK